MKLGDTVHIIAFGIKIGTARIEQIITTYKFNPPFRDVTYKLDDGLEYKKDQIKFDKELSRDNRLNDLLS